MKIKTGGGRMPEKPPKFGGIRDGVLYRRDEAMAKLGIGAAGFRQLVADGMKVGRIGKRTYVLGEHIISAVFSRQSQPQPVVHQ